MKLFSMFLIACIISIAAAGQTNSTVVVDSVYSKDCIMIKDGKLMVLKNGQLSTMEKDATMEDGTLVTADGKVKMKNGKTVKLKEGDSVYPDGRLVRKSDKKKKPGKKV